MLDGIPFATLGPAGLAALAVLLILTGRLITLREYNEKKEEANHWREAYEKERDAHHITQRQSDQLLELAKTTKQLIQAIVRPAGANPESGGSDVAVPPQAGSGS